MSLKMFYSYSELSEEAKENARGLIMNSPLLLEPWNVEHNESLHAAIEAIKNATSLKSIIKESKNYEFTGYCADGLLYDYIEEYKIKKIEDIEIHVLSDYFNNAWEKEIESRKSKEYIEEEIMINEYLFSSSGETLK